MTREHATLESMSRVLSDIAKEIETDYPLQANALRNMSNEMLRQHDSIIGSVQILRDYLKLQRDD